MLSGQIGWSRFLPCCHHRCCCWVHQRRTAVWWLQRHWGHSSARRGNRSNTGHLSYWTAFFLHGICQGVKRDALDSWRAGTPSSGSPAQSRTVSERWAASGRTRSVLSRQLLLLVTLSGCGHWESSWWVLGSEERNPLLSGGKRIPQINFLRTRAAWSLWSAHNNPSLVPTKRLLTMNVCTLDTWCFRVQRNVGKCFKVISKKISRCFVVFLPKAAKWSFLSSFKGNKSNIVNNCNEKSQKLMKFYCLENHNTAEFDADWKNQCGSWQNGSVLLFLDCSNLYAGVCYDSHFRRMSQHTVTLLTQKTTKKGGLGYFSHTVMCVLFHKNRISSSFMSSRFNGNFHYSSFCCWMFDKKNKKNKVDSTADLSLLGVEFLCSTTTSTSSALPLVEHIEQHTDPPLPRSDEPSYVETVTHAGQCCVLHMFLLQFESMNS